MQQNKCFKCGAKKATKLGDPISRGNDMVQRVRCDKCSQIRFNVIKPRKAKEIKDGSDSDSKPADN